MNNDRGDTILVILIVKRSILLILKTTDNFLLIQ